MPAPVPPSTQPATPEIIEQPPPPHENNNEPTEPAPPPSENNDDVAEEQLWAPKVITMGNQQWVVVKRRRFTIPEAVLGDTTFLAVQRVTIEDHIPLDTIKYLAALMAQPSQVFQCWLYSVADYHCNAEKPLS